MPIVPILHGARTSWRWHMQEWEMTNACGARYKRAYETRTNRVCEFEPKHLPMTTSRVCYNSTSSRNYAYNMFPEDLKSRSKNCIRLDLPKPSKLRMQTIRGISIYPIMTTPQTSILAIPCSGKHVSVMDLRFTSCFIPSSFPSLSPSSSPSSVPS